MIDLCKNWDGKTFIFVFKRNADWKMHSEKKENARLQNFLCLKRRKVQILWFSLTWCNSILLYCIFIRNFTIVCCRSTAKGGCGTTKKRTRKSKTLEDRRGAKKKRTPGERYKFYDFPWHDAIQCFQSFTLLLL